MIEIIIISLLVLFVLIFIILPPSRGKVEKYVDKDGNIIKGSIAEKKFLQVNDSKLGMYIMAKDKNKPVILFLGGGPGIPEYLLEKWYHTGMADEFVVCYLEYRGSSLSFNSKVSSSSMTTEQYLEDIKYVTDYLRERFNKEKIYLLGHSFGTYMGLLAADKYYDKYHAYIAMSQNCNQRESEYRAYYYMKEEYKKLGKDSMVKKFENYSIRESDENYNKYFTSPLRDKAMHDLGVGTTRNMHSVISGIFFPSLRCRVYTPIERINIWRGKILCNKAPVVKDGINFNAFLQVKSINIPIYFLAGKYDYTCCYSLQEEYFHMIKAPKKEFYTFSKSAHSPLFEESEKGIKILKSIIKL